MISRILRESSIFLFFLFLFMFIVGTFTTNVESHILLASTQLPDYFIFNMSRSIGNFFFFLMGKSTYFMVFVFVAILLEMLFRKGFFSYIAYRIFIIILSGTILSGMFSPSLEWLEGGVIGSFSNDLFSGFFLHALVGTSLILLMFFYSYQMIKALVFEMGQPSSWKKFFYKKNTLFSRKDFSQNVVEQETASIPDITPKTEIHSDSVEDILASLEKEETKLGLSQIYTYRNHPDFFGKLLTEFIRNLYQIQLDSIKNSKNTQIIETRKNEIQDNSPQTQNTEISTFNKEENLIEIQDYVIHSKEDEIDRLWNADIVEDMIDYTSSFLEDQFCIKERLDDIFNSLHSSYSLPYLSHISSSAEILGKEENIKEALPYVKEAFYSRHSALAPEDSSPIFEEQTEKENQQVEQVVKEDFITDETVSYDEIDKDINPSYEVENTTPDTLLYQDLGREFIGEEEPAENSILFDFPSLELLKNSTPLEEHQQEDKEFIGDQIIDILKEFNIQAELDKIIVGPVVTRYEIKPPKGLKVNKITELDDNIALGLASKDRIRIEAPVFGKSVVGLEVPNLVREVVTFKDIADVFEKQYKKENYNIPFLMGKSLDGDILIRDLVKMPHLLIAGSTGSGKSVCVNTLINSILYYKDPSEVKLLLVDPKRVELILYDGLPHLISPVIKETPEAIKALKWLVAHMEERYTILEEKQVRNISEYNQMQQEQSLEKMPYIVVVMDEFADLILLGKRDVEESVIRLAAMARAVGIHLVLATQRPSADVITGLIKANFPSRIAFKVSSKMESRIILDENGAENLLGKGDMLFLSADGGAMTQRIQSPLMSDEEVRAVCSFFKARYPSNYWDEVLESSLDSIEGADADLQDEPLFKEAVEVVMREKKASASYLQRRLKVGYNRAARMIETMEEMGVISRANGSRPREVLIEEWEW